jgi:hypothetical protein
MLNTAVHVLTARLYSEQVKIQIVYQRRISQTRQLYHVKKQARGGYMFRPFKRPSVK